MSSPGSLITECVSAFLTKIKNDFNALTLLAAGVALLFMRRGSVIVARSVDPVSLRDM